MKELEKIVVEAQLARKAGKPVALATVVGVIGSGYRLPGARMLIVDGKWIAGSISGGCLEDDVILRAGEAIKTNQAIVTTYDTTDDDDIVFGVGLGCKGVITILIEPIAAAENQPDFIDFVQTCIEQRVSGIVATVIGAESQTQVKPGQRLLFKDSIVATDIEDIELKAKLLEHIESHAQPSSSVIMPLKKGSCVFFIERIDPPTPLVIFGAGHDAIPIVRLAKELGWHVTVVDHRQGYATTARFPAADRILISTPEQIFSHLTFTDETLAVIMTHNYLRDQKLLQLLLSSPSRYVGLLGPRKRTQQLLADLEQQDFKFKPEQIGQLHAPVGLDVGSESPAEVALSILAEMQAVITGRNGGFLRDRQTPIHGTSTPLPAASTARVRKAS